MTDETNGAWGPAASWSRKRERVVLAAVLAVHVLVRCILLVYSPHVYDEEEAKTGSIGALVHEKGLFVLPLSLLQTDHYEGGSLAAGLMSVPFMAVLGPIGLAVKALALSLSLLLVLAAYCLVKSTAGPAAGAVTVLLLTLGPPYISQYGWIPEGNYHEETVFTLLGLVLLGRVLEASRPSPWRMAGLGFLLGLAIWFHFGNAVLGLLCLLALGLRFGRVLWFAPAGALVLGVLTGLGPLFAYLMTISTEGLERASPVFAVFTRAPWDSFAVMVERLLHLVAVDLPGAYHFSDIGPVPVQVPAMAYHACFLASLWLLWPSLSGGLRDWRARPGELPRGRVAGVLTLAYVLLYGLVFCASSYRVGGMPSVWGSLDKEAHVHIYAMLVPMVVLMGMAAPWRVRRPRLALGLWITALSLGFAGNVGLIEGDPAVQQERLWEDVYSTGVIELHAGQKHALQPRVLKDIAEALRAAGMDTVQFLYFGAGIQRGLFPGPNYVETPRWADEYPPEMRPYFLVGLGTGLHSGWRDDLKPLREILRAAPAGTAPFLEAGYWIAAAWYKMEHGFRPDVRALRELVGESEWPRFHSFLEYYDDYRRQWPAR